MHSTYPKLTRTERIRQIYLFFYQHTASPSIDILLGQRFYGGVSRAIFFDSASTLKLPFRGRLNPQF